MNNSPSWYLEGRGHIWHPYSQMKYSQPKKVKSAKGTKIILEDETELIDSISSWWCVCHGHNHPHITSEIKDQLEKIQHVMFAGLAHEEPYKLSTRLSKLTPKGLNKAFFSDSGSISIEVAMKIAIQYFYNQGKIKNKFIAFKNSYHGDTFAAMSVSDSQGFNNKIFSNILPQNFFFDIPKNKDDLLALDNFISQNKDIAGLLIEPLVQGAGGIKFHSPEILREIYNICKKNNILFIADEIATGFYRTGKIFASKEAEISPDIMTIGKALTGGSIGLAATIVQDEIFDQFLGEDITNSFMHGPTYMANAISCRAANASLDLFERSDYEIKVKNIENIFNDLSRSIKKTNRIKETRVKGAIFSLEFTEISYEEIVNLREEFYQHGIWNRPFSNIIYFMPPFIISEQEIIYLFEKLNVILTNLK